MRNIDRILLINMGLSIANILNFIVILMAFGVYLSLKVPDSLIILATLVACSLQLLYWLLIFNGLHYVKDKILQDSFPPVSLVICTRNALHDLKANLSFFIAQDYPATFEIVLVDDDSHDGTREWLESSLSACTNLRYYRHIKTKPGKKDALAFGISKASHFWIALSDADCRPVSRFWLQTMMSNAVGETKIILGYAPYKKSKSLLNGLIRFETCLNVIQSFSAVRWGIPYSGAGRNMVYHKSIFDYPLLKPQLAYGDDDFLISAKANKKNTQICTTPEAFVYSDPETKYKNYFLQKWRHYASAKSYTVKTKMYLLLYFISFAGLYLGLFLLICLSYYMLAMTLFALYTGISWFMFSKHAKKLNEEDLRNYYPIIVLFYLLHIIIQWPFLWIKKSSW
jgi:glycosyltransferase involved in cell wall biosynthesis